MGNDPGGGRQVDLEMVLEAVYLYFKGDRSKVEDWLREPNAKIGGEVPIDLIRENRMDVIADLIRTMISEM